MTRQTPRKRPAIAGVSLHRRQVRGVVVRLQECRNGGLEGRPATSIRLPRARHAAPTVERPATTRGLGGTMASTITRGDPPDLKNVRANVYHHYVRVDNPTSLIFLSGQLSRD